MALIPFAAHSCSKCHEALALEFDGNDFRESKHKCWADPDPRCGSDVEARERAEAACPFCGVRVTIYEVESTHEALRDECCGTRPAYKDGRPWSLDRAEAALARHERSRRK